MIYWPMNEQHENVSAKQLDVALAAVDDTNGTTGMATHDGRCGYMCEALDSWHFCHAPALVQDPAFIALATLFTPCV